MRAAKEGAERARLAQAMFLAAVSHDLRQPVQALTLFTSALASKITGAAASTLIEDMRRSVETLDMLLDAMLDVSSLDAGIIVPHETTFSLATVLERVVAEFEPQANQKEIGIRLVPSSAIVRTDPTLLCRILQNFALFRRKRHHKVCHTRRNLAVGFSPQYLGEKLWPKLTLSPP